MQIISKYKINSDMRDCIKNAKIKNIFEYLLLNLNTSSFKQVQIIKAFVLFMIKIKCLFQ